MTFKSVDEILDFAIKNEEIAAQFYTDLSERGETVGIRELFQQFALEEQGHKKLLLQVKSGKRELLPDAKVADLKIAEYTVEMKPSAEITYQDALLLAMQAEKKAFMLYSDLAARVDDENLRNTFLGLAQEEAKHKLRFEIEYDENILSEN